MRFWAGLLLGLFGQGLAAQALRPVYLAGGKMTAPASGWQLVFHDEFLGPQLDTTKWLTYFPYGPDGSDACDFCRTHGQEGQIYRDEQARVQDGILRLVATLGEQEWRGQCRPYRSGMIHSRQPWQFKEGRFEVRFRIPRGRNFWPAFWLFGWDGHEIDVFEFDTNWPERFQTTVHKGDQHPSIIHAGPNFAKDFQLLVLEWTPWYLRWELNGQEVRTIPRLRDFQTQAPLLPPRFFGPGTYWEADVFPSWPLSLILNLAVNNYGVDGITPLPICDSMEVDYLRVYQRPPLEAGRVDLCQERRIEGPTTLRLPSWYTFQGPHTELEWQCSPNLEVLLDQAQGILVMPRRGQSESGGWIRVQVDRFGRGPCAPVLLEQKIILAP